MSFTRPSCRLLTLASLRAPKPVWSRLVIPGIRSYTVDIPRQPPPPPPLESTRQPKVEAFEGPSQPRQYYQRPHPRELPKLQKKWPVILGFTALAVTGWGTFFVFATNQEKISSSVFRSIMISVRHDPKLREALGEAIRPQPEWWLNGDPYVNGKIGQLQGNIDISFRIKGSKGAGTVYFTSIRREKGEPFTTLRFKVICDDGTVLHVDS